MQGGKRESIKTNFVANISMTLKLVFVHECILFNFKIICFFFQTSLYGTNVDVSDNGNVMFADTEPAKKRQRRKLIRLFVVYCVIVSIIKKYLGKRRLFK